MDWTRVILGGLAAGIVANVADFVLHGVIMADTYRRYPQVFSQTPANPLFFVLVSLCIGITVAILFGRTRASWAPGWKGGLVFGFYLGVAQFFINFYDPLIFDGFPYYLAWCWGGISLIVALLAGTVLGAIVKRA